MKVARYAVVGSLCAALAFCWALWQTDLLVPNLGYILALLGSIGVLAVLIGFISYCIVKLIKSDYGKGTGWLVFLFGLVLIAALTILTITNWWVGPSFRMMLGLSDTLPNSNLFVAGGWIAYTSVALIILLVVSTLLSIKPITTTIRTFSFRRSNNSKDEKQADKVPPRSVSIG